MKDAYKRMGRYWKRGTEIARQNIAGIDNDAETLKDMLEKQLAHRNATAGLDYRFLQFTARKLAACKDSEGNGVDAHSYNLRSVRTVRRVIKLAPYKRIFAEQMRPVFLEEVQRKLDDAQRAPALEAATDSERPAHHRRPMER